MFIKSLFLLSDKHSCIDRVYLVYLLVQRVSAVQISHRQVGHGYTKRVEGRGLSF